jgi:hypothetical protein
MNLDDVIVHDLSRMMLIFAHVISCAVAIGLAFFADFRVLRSRGTPTRHDVEIVNQVARFVTLALIALWLTGAGVILLDFGHVPSLAEILQKPKLSTKMFVVSVLTLNGLALHHYALPRMGRMNLWCALIGGVSASSWMFAAFLGVAKPLGSLLSIPQFLAIYSLVLLTGLLTACMVFRWQRAQNDTVTTQKTRSRTSASWQQVSTLQSLAR